MSAVSNKPLIVACIPAYDEERTIARVVLKTKKYVDRVVVCDDGSGDLTREIAGGLGAAVVRHDRSMGYSAYDINNSVLTIGVGKGNV